MTEVSLEVFVDESGRMRHPDAESRFYIVGLVLHESSDDIASSVRELEAVEAELGLEGHCFHAGPLLRKEKGYEFMSRALRGRILSRMMAFAHRVDFKYRCFAVDKKFIDSAEQIVTQLGRQISAFLLKHRDEFLSSGRVRIYYDCGQSPVTNLLHAMFEENLGKGSVEFVQGVRPERYRLFQLADLLCTLTLIDLRLRAGVGMTPSEMRFFGGPRDFKRNILKKLQGKKLA